LNRQVTKTADALHGHGVTWTRTAVAQCVERGDAGAEQGRGIDCRKLRRHSGDRLLRHDGIFGIATVEGDAGDLSLLAVEKVSATARIALKAMPSVPAHTHSITGPECVHIGSQ